MGRGKTCVPGTCTHLPAAAARRLRLSCMDRLLIPLRLRALLLTHSCTQPSSLAAGIASAIIFWLNRVCILRRENSTNLAIYMYPLLVGVTVFINGGWLEISYGLIRCRWCWNCTYICIGLGGMQVAEVIAGRAIVCCSGVGLTSNCSGRRRLMPKPDTCQVSAPLTLGLRAWTCSNSFLRDLQGSQERGSLGLEQGRLGGCVHYCW